MFCALAKWRPRIIGEKLTLFRPMRRPPLAFPLLFFGPEADRPLRRGHVQKGTKGSWAAKVRFPRFRGLARRYRGPLERPSSPMPVESFEPGNRARREDRDPV